MLKSESESNPNPIHKKMFGVEGLQSSGPQSSGTTLKDQSWKWRKYDSYFGEREGGDHYREQFSVLILHSSFEFLLGS